MSLRKGIGFCQQSEAANDLAALFNEALILI